jgi:hypothetical protein
MNEELVKEYIQKLKGKVFDWADYYNRSRRIESKDGKEITVLAMEYASFPIFPLNPDNPKHLENVEKFVRFYLEQNEEDRLQKIVG